LNTVSNHPAAPCPQQHQLKRFKVHTRHCDTERSWAPGQPGQGQDEDRGIQLGLGLFVLLIAAVGDAGYLRRRYASQVHRPARQRRETVLRAGRTRVRSEKVRNFR
jgi:hypothetical protein